MTEPPPNPTSPSGSSRTLVITLGVVVVVLVVAIAAIVGYLVLGRSADGGFPTGESSSPASVATTPSTLAAPSEPPSPARPPVRTTTRTDTPTTDDAGPTVAGAPNGSTPCPVRYGRTGLYGASSVGSPVTSCGFAEEVREAYADSGRPGQLPRTVSAVSPETGVRYAMSCAAQRDIVTCTGGDDAVVYLYR